MPLIMPRLPSKSHAVKRGTKLRPTIHFREMPQNGLFFGLALSRSRCTISPIYGCGRSSPKGFWARLLGGEG
jgi:hypothetical protein